MPKTGKWFLLADVSALFLAFILGTGLTELFGDDSLIRFPPSVFARQFCSFASLGVAAFLWFDTRGHYRNRLPYWEALGHIVGVVLTGLIVAGFLQFAFHSKTSRIWLLFSWILLGGLLFSLRVLVRIILERTNSWAIPAVMIGTGPVAEAAKHALDSEPEMGYRVLTTLSAERLADLEEPNAWTNLLDGMEATTILLALEGSELSRYKNAITALGRDRVPYALMPSWYGLPLRGLSRHFFLMHDVMMLQDTDPLSLPLPRLIKRLFDIVVAGVIFIALIPLFFAVALAILLEGGPVFYSQPRVGKDGKHFPCYKFRSMRVDADAVLQRTLAEDSSFAKEWEEFQKLKDDPRLTRLGAVLRKTSIDELPQLLNVLKGDMSLVGPRPIMLGQESFYGDDFNAYCSVRPGITGPWQVAGRNRLTFEERVRLETWYTRNWTLWLDIVIILKTIPALAFRSGAH